MRADAWCHTHSAPGGPGDGPTAHGLPFPHVGSARLSQAQPQLFCPPCPTQNGFLQGRTEARIRAAPGITGKRAARERGAGPVGRGGDSRAHGSEEHTGQVAGEGRRGQTLSTSPGQGPVQVLDLCKVRR